MKKENVIMEKTYKYAVDIAKSYWWMVKTKKEYVASKQLFRSGTSVGANVEEAQEAQSMADFISKMSIALKEACESRFWLRLICDSDIVTRDQLKHLFDQVNEIIPILKSIIISSKKNKNK